MKKNNIILSILFLISITILIILLPLTYKTVKAYNDSTAFVDSILKIQQNNNESIFEITKITYYSGCNAKGDTNSNSSFTISDLYQYTDIAIFINPVLDDELTSKNTLKNVLINNIQYVLAPSMGNQKLYYKNLSDFATSKFNQEDLIDKSINFIATSENNIDYSKPILYNNCANPITICYVNSGIKENYTFSNDISKIAYNGSLLKMCGIALSSLNCKISLDITITNNLDETYFCPITLNIPLSTENSTIYDGNLTIKDSVNYKFIKTT